MGILLSSARWSSGFGGGPVTRQDRCCRFWSNLWPTLLFKLWTRELRRIGHLRHHYVLIRQRSWFRLSFCQGWTTATLCWRVSRKQAGMPTESTKQYSSSRPWQTRARPWESFAQVPRARTDYKISIRCYRSRYLSVPAYLFDILSVYEPYRSLHSAGLMAVPRIKLNKHGKRTLILIHRTSDLDFHSQASTWCSKYFLLHIQPENVPLKKKKKKHLCWGHLHLESDSSGCWTKLECLYGYLGI